MEKYKLSLNRNGKIECVCNRGEIGCPSLNFKDLKSLYSFLKDRISAFDEFTLDQDGINITWHEKDGEIHRIRSAKIDFTANLRNAIDEDINAIYGEYRRHREALDFLKARCREELHKSNYTCDNSVLFSYCDRILNIYTRYGKIDTLYDEESDKRFLEFMIANRKNFIDEKYKKIDEEENESNKKDMIISACTGATYGCLFASPIHSPLFIITTILGVAIASGIFRGCINKKHDTQVIMCRQGIDEIPKFIETLKDNLNNSKNRRYDGREEFYSFIKQDIDYMNSHSRKDYADLLAQVEKLQASYTKAFLERQNIDIYHYLLALAYLEIDIYSKESGIGLKSEYACPLNRETIIQRLQLMGFNDQNEDAIIKTILDSVDRIVETPFVGCEAEVARLNRIAIDYAIEVLKHLRQDSDFDVTKIDAVIEESHDETSLIANKLQTARKYEELCSLIDDLNAHLAVDPNMNLEQGMTLPQ